MKILREKNNFLFKKNELIQRLEKRNFYKKINLSELKYIESSLSANKLYLLEGYILLLEACEVIETFEQLEDKLNPEVNQTECIAFRNRFVDAFAEEAKVK